MVPRMRLVGWNVQPVMMLDDGDNLTPIQVAPQTIPAAAWDAFKAGGDAEALASVQAQIDEQIKQIITGRAVDNPNAGNGPANDVLVTPSPLAEVT